MKKTTLNIAMAGLIASTLFSTGCATIFGKSNYDIAINSNPAGATLSIVDRDGKEVYKGTTPATVNLKSSAGYMSKAEYRLKFDLEGHEQKIVTLTSKLNGWYFGNILLGGLIGMLIIDPASGAMYQMPAVSVDETLNKKSTAQLTELKIVDINSLSKSDVSKLQKID
ncbi:hypothetical protein [Pedobacter sp. Hv1]|uniref:hypothetical protein n=1 Tax=Pedobacter sp. Hv1 TaxID=1740090 RepID=UPI0006D88F55|nr:hypothetical protein [Pedobacter sp. Hv1]KQC00229.1 hypothetical protein AQF98_12050 [Pedobacter sp. Hv1]